MALALLTGGQDPAARPPTANRAILGNEPRIRVQVRAHEGHERLAPARAAEAQRPRVDDLQPARLALEVAVGAGHEAPRRAAAPASAGACASRASDAGVSGLRVLGRYGTAPAARVGGDGHGGGARGAAAGQQPAAGAPAAARRSRDHEPPERRPHPAVSGGACESASIRRSAQRRATSANTTIASETTITIEPIAITSGSSAGVRELEYSTTG